MRVAALEGHTLWASTYDAGLNPILALERRMLADLLTPVEGECFVDVACGTGRWMTYLHQYGATVLGADASPEMLSKACSKRTIKGRVVLADAASLPFRDRVAGVTLCSFAAAYFPSLKAAMAEMARVTRPGGRVVLSDLHPATVAAGWTRSFRLDGLVYEIEHLNPSLDDFHTAARQANLQLHMQLDAPFGDSERLIFRAAGKAHVFPDVSRVPAVWIGIWTKI